MCDTKKLITTPYRPQCDGVVERLNGTLATSLTAYGKANQDNWDEFLPSFLMAYRTSTHNLGAWHHALSHVVWKKSQASHGHWPHSSQQSADFPHKETFLM